MSPTIQSEKIQKNDIVIHILVSIISFPDPACTGLFPDFLACIAGSFCAAFFICHSQSKRSVWACWKLNFSQIRKGEGRGWGLEGREMNCLFSSPWVFFIHHLPVFSPFLPLIVLRTRTDILSFMYFLQIIIASHIHAIYNHSLEERRRVEPGNTPVKKRTSSQSQVQLLSKQSFCLLII